MQYLSYEKNGNKQKSGRVWPIFQSILAGTIFEELNETGATIFADYFSKANLSNLLDDESRPVTIFAPV